MPTLQKSTQTIEAASFDTLAAMPGDIYLDYLKYTVFNLNRGILRAGQGDYPIALNREQMRQLINYLSGIEHEIND